MIQLNRTSDVKTFRQKKEPLILVCDTGIHHATRNLVGGVVQKSQRERKDFQNYMVRVREISNGVAKALRSGDDEDLGTLMYKIHDLLRKMGVSLPNLDHFVETQRQPGPLGASLAGA